MPSSSLDFFRIYSDDNILPEDLSPRYTISGSDPYFYIRFIIHDQIPLEPTLEVEVCSCVPCEIVLEDVPEYTHMLLSEIIRDEHIARMTPEIEDYAVSLIQHYRTSSETTHNRLLTIFVEMTVTREEENGSEANWGPPQSVEQFPMASARKKAVESLKEVRVVNDGAEVERCSICLEDFEDGEDALTMPCDHFYHKNCIVNWLNRRLTCPLCRYKLPLV